MKYICIFLIFFCSHCVNAQCVTTMSFALTLPTCSTCCNGSGSVTSTCGITYTWMPGAITSWVANNLCAGATYTVYSQMASTVCCGATVGTATVYIPKPAETSVSELIELKNIIVSPNPSNGNIIISTSGSIEYSVQITIHDINGIVVYNNQSQINNNNSTIYLDAKDGVYFVTITDKETLQRVVKRIVVQK